MITQETVEKVYLTFLAPFSGVVLPFPSKRSSIVGRIAKLLFLASHKEICPEAFSTPMKKRPSREKFLIARPEPDLKHLAEGGQVLSARVHRQTPMRVHPRGVTISCIRQLASQSVSRPHFSWAMSKTGLRANRVFLLIRCFIL